MKILPPMRIAGLLPEGKEPRITIRESYFRRDRGLEQRTEMQMADGSWQLIAVFWFYPMEPFVFFHSKGWEIL